ncbi:hypothetical protein Ddye_002058 [Dipteronia dyeriana]|uniref:Uncharacterized protein n=1 Tax=Dipteronia dyeriana TaxID=168575 RepID=A0AAD9XPT4_9ROSI|nr:hypothetical protein Ddye_002058 [Dipteronia dyeriana]
MEVFMWQLLKGRVLVREVMFRLGMDFISNLECPLCRKENETLVVNVDGSVIGKPSPTSIRGVLRDSSGKVMCLFSFFMGIFDSNTTEVWDVKKAIELCISILELPSQSQFLVKFSCTPVASEVIGSLPVARIISDEGGVGSDMIDFAKFRRRVGKKCGINDSKAFYDFQQRHGRAGDPLYVLMLENLEGASRLSISNHIEFDEQKFIALMDFTDI